VNISLHKGGINHLKHLVYAFVNDFDAFVCEPICYGVVKFNLVVL
jgi:hypothetical protein